MTAETAITEAAARFITELRWEDLPAEALEIGRRCMIDTIGLYVAGTTEDCVRILVADAVEQGGRAEARLPGAGGMKVPAALAARALGTAGHAHDWDDTQVSHDPAHVYGLLTHPSVPALTGALVIAQRLGGVDGRRLMLAFQTGFEVECKLSEWLLPAHYLRGHHSSGTVGIFGSCAAAAKLLGLDAQKTAIALGIAASLSAGIRCNFGTMSKPLHVGRASENGVTAALLAARGFTADPTGLDGPWGFLQVMGGISPEKVAQGFGRTFTIVSPGVSIKPYPSGILTHQSMDAMRDLVLAEDVKPENVTAIRFYAASNVLKPIRYPIAVNHLQAKFSMPALLSMIVLRRQAGPDEFTNDFVGGAEMQAMQRRIETIHDPEIEARGFDRIRSRIEIDTADGRTLVQWADERYRGGPSKPFTEADIEEKFRVCTEGRLGAAASASLLKATAGIADLADTSALTDWMQDLA
ncbi:MAG: MmgE/PrpD family protein [Rhodobacteraceae bacterium]|nr:MmgE/PrpD family protein [Paracoccaceae bacterium]